MLAAERRLRAFCQAAGNNTDGTLYLAWKGQSTDKIFYAAIFQVAASVLALSDWIPQASEPQALISHRPALAVRGNLLYYARRWCGSPDAGGRGCAR